MGLILALGLALVAAPAAAFSPLNVPALRYRVRDKPTLDGSGGVVVCGGTTWCSVSLRVRVPPRASVQRPHAAFAHVSRAPVQRASCAGGALAARLELDGMSSRRAFAAVRRRACRHVMHAGWHVMPATCLL